MPLPHMLHIKPEIHIEPAVDIAVEGDTVRASVDLTGCVAVIHVDTSDFPDGITPEAAQLIAAAALNILGTSIVHEATQKTEETYFFDELTDMLKEN